MYINILHLKKCIILYIIQGTLLILIFFLFSFEEIINKMKCTNVLVICLFW
jgi:hypothetical protein